MTSFVYKNPKYNILWVSAERRFILGGFNDLDEGSIIIENWHQTRPRHKLKPKLISNKTGQVVYD